MSDIIEKLKNHITTFIKYDLPTDTLLVLDKFRYIYLETHLEKFYEQMLELFRNILISIDASYKIQIFLFVISLETKIPKDLCSQFLNKNKLLYNILCLTNSIELFDEYSYRFKNVMLISIPHDFLRCNVDFIINAINKHQEIKDYFQNIISNENLARVNSLELFKQYSKFQNENINFECYNVLVHACYYNSYNIVFYMLNNYKQEIINSLDSEKSLDVLIQKGILYLTNTIHLFTFLIKLNVDPINVLSSFIKNIGNVNYFTLGVIHKLTNIMTDLQKYEPEIANKFMFRVEFDTPNIIYNVIAHYIKYLTHNPATLLSDIFLTEQNYVSTKIYELLISTFGIDFVSDFLHFSHKYYAEKCVKLVNKTIIKKNRSKISIIGTELGGSTSLLLNVPVWNVFYSISNWI